MWQAAAILGGVGMALGAGLAYVALKVAVPPDPRQTAIREALPGANCGACGYPGCDGCAAAMARGEAEPSACPVAGPEATAQIAGILGQEVAATEPQVAAVHCVGTNATAVRSYAYAGIQDCRAAAMMPGGGPKACSYGCLGLGTCAEACPFDALHMDPETGLPVVDREKCTGCGICVQVCPKGVMELVPRSQQVLVACRNHDKGPVVRKICSTGCIGCGLCVRSCPQKTIRLENFLAVIDPSGCDGCGTCVEKCPTKNIVWLLAEAGVAVQSAG